MKFKLCGWAGCDCLTQSYYCEKHKALAEKNKKKPFEGAKRYTDYHSPEWNLFKNGVIKETGYCEKCGATNNLQVHHIIPVRYAPDLFLKRENVQVLCRLCHQAETAREIRGRRK